MGQASKIWGDIMPKEYPIDNEFWKWWNDFWQGKNNLNKKSLDEIKSHKIVDDRTLNLWRENKWMLDKNYKKP